MGRRAQTTTIADVARLAGVSPATVSRVMNGNFRGEPAMAERVRAAAAELDYSPSPLARSLALGTTRTIAFLVPDLANPAFQAVLSGLSRSAARDGYRVLVADSVEAPDDEAPLALEVRRRCDCVVLCAPRMPEEQLREIAEQLQPMVLINRTLDADDAETASVPAVSVDYRTGIQNLARQLHALGHRDILFLEGPEGSVSNLARRDGLDAFAAATPDARITRLPGGVGIEDGVAAAPAVRDAGATAVLAFNDLVAVGLVHGLRELGVDVPGDVSVTGFDDIPVAHITTPPLTTASVPHAELGALAWQRLQAVITGETVPGDAVVEPRIEVRGSTAALPAAP